MKLKTLASGFNMSIDELVTRTGYTRQQLYNMVQKGKANNEFIKKLKHINRFKTQDEILKAKINYGMRDDLINQLKGE